jgi:hypothetical protein
MARANKAQAQLPEPQLLKLLEELRALAAKPTGKQIQEVLAKYGVRLSVDRAIHFRKTTFEDYLAELKQKQAAAELVAQATAGGKSATAAGLAVGTQRMLDLLTDPGAEVTNEDLTAFVFALARAKKGDEDLRALEAKLRESESRLKLRTRQLEELERKEAEQRARAAAALNRAHKKGGLSKAAKDALREELGLAA